MAVRLRACAAPSTPRAARGAGRKDWGPGAAARRAASRRGAPGRREARRSGARSPPGGRRARTPPRALPLVAGADVWGTSCCLGAAATLGMWSEKCALGRALSGPLVSTLIALLLSNCGVMSSRSPAFAYVYAVLLPVAVPMLLYNADLKRVITKTRSLFWAYALASLATLAATLVAISLFPLPSLGEDAWKITAALTARHIGSAVNYVAVNEALGVSASVQSAGLAADNLVCALYFAALFSLARREGAAEAPGGGGAGAAAAPAGAGPDWVRLSATALAVSVAIVCAGRALMARLGVAGYLLPAVSTITVAMATALPRQSARLAPAGEALSRIILAVFFATVGAEASVATVVRTAPQLFAFSLVQVFVHLGIVLGAAAALPRIPRREYLVASNAAVGGPTTAGAMAASMDWSSLCVPTPARWRRIAALISRNAQPPMLLRPPDRTPPLRPPRER